MRNLTQAQQQAIETRGEAVAVRAAAGSGKTTVLVERYLNLLAHKQKPSQILTVTFTNEAADQMKERILRRLEDVPFATPELKEEVRTTTNIGTIHSFCYRVLNQYGGYLRCEPIESIVSPFQFSDEFQRSYDQWLEELPKEHLTYFLKFFHHRDLADLAKQGYRKRFAFERALTHIEKYTKPEKALIEHISKWLLPLYKKIERSFWDRGLYSFDELEELSLKLLTDFEEVRKDLGARFESVLVDEFQDTSPEQWAIVQHLIGENRERLFVVGDPKQSIYRFRGAEATLFEGICETIQKGSGSVIELNTNYRTGPALLEKINLVSRTLFEDSEIPFHPMVAHREDTTQFETILFDGEKRGEAAPFEVAAAVAKVQKLIDEGAKPSEIALLFRVSDRIAEFETALVGEGIPVRAQKTQSLFKTYDVLDLVSFLRFVADPLDDFSLAGFLRSPYVRFSYADLVELHSRPGDSLFEKLIENAPSNLQWLPALIEEGETNTETVLSRLFEETNHWPSAKEPVRYLLSAIKSHWNVFETVEQLKNWQKMEIPCTEIDVSQPNKVRLMTVHASKGLEFPHVLLVDNLRQPPRGAPSLRIDPTMVPGIRYRRKSEPETTEVYEMLKNKDAAAEKEESKRILYVALTRAEDSVTVFLPKNEKVMPKLCWAALIRDALQS